MVELTVWSPKKHSQLSCYDSQNREQKNQMFFLASLTAKSGHVTQFWPMNYKKYTGKELQAIDLLY